MMMRVNRIATLCTLAVSLGAALAPRTAAAQQGPCAQIRAACDSAGFERGTAKAGNGILVDCIMPIMQDKPQPRRASKPLPQIDPQLVEACRTRNPNFGQRNGPPPGAPAAPDAPPDAPPGTMAPKPQT
jgi:hypothetical protein